MKKLNSKLLLLIFVFVAFLFRFYLIFDNNIYFWYDQARDAHVSQSMIKNHDLKIQGPSASGTNDTIYHGVFYYYLIGPIYTVFGGDPFLVTVFFAFVNSFAIIIFYFLLSKIFKNKDLSLIGTLLLVFNFEHAQYSTWLSNPMIALIPVLIFFYAIWELFYEEVKRKNNVKNFMLLAISLGLIEQSAFYSVYFFGAILIAVVYRLIIRKDKIKDFLNLKNILIFSLVYFLMIFTMLLNQFKLYKAGIFNLSSLKASLDGNEGLTKLNLIPELFKTYVNKIIESTTPGMIIFGFILLLFLVLVLLKKLEKNQRWFLLSWIFAPLFLFVIHFRSSPHMLFGIEYPLLIIFAYFLFSLKNNRNMVFKFLAYFIFIIYLFCQFNAIKKVRNLSTSIFTPQSGVMLKNKLAIVDRTYQLANGDDFSISLWSAPYEYYIAWAYVYDWYGKENYNYVPNYFGTSQVGKFGAELLKQNSFPEKNHFLVEEPDLFLVGDIYKDFIANQDNFTRVVFTNYSDTNGFEKFGEYKLQSRFSIN